MKRDALGTTKVLVTYPLRWQERIQKKAKEIALPGTDPSEQDIWRWAMAIALFPEECGMQKKEVKP